MASSIVDVTQKDALGDLPTNLTVGTRLICLGFNNRTDCAGSLPTANLSDLASKLLKDIGQRFESEIETFQCLSIVGTCLIALAYLFVLLHVLLPPDRQSSSAAKFSLSMAVVFGLAGAIINIVLPEWIFQRISDLIESHKFVKPIMRSNQSLQYAVTICAVFLLPFLGTVVWYPRYAKKNL